MSVRAETDSLGQIDVEDQFYWGAQTQRSLMNFKIGEDRFCRPFIKAMGIVKKAAAMSNFDLGLLDKTKKDLIIAAADEVIDGKLDLHFPLVVWQTGSGTQTNMNINEVVSNRAIELAGGKKGSKTPIHPNDHVNLSQSSNDSFPTFMHVAIAQAMATKLIPQVEDMIEVIKNKSKDFESITKIGRTHLMDATPLTLGQEWSGYHAQMIHHLHQLKASQPSLLELAMGGTAVGTGLNTHKDYASTVAKHIAGLTSLNFKTAPNKFAALSAHDAVLSCSAALRGLSVALHKIAADIRLLGSGPRCGLGELLLPENEPGSSIMPGKVNPTQCEALTMVCARVMGNDVSTMAGNMHGTLQLNVYKPLMVHCVLGSIRLLTDGIQSFTHKCLVGIEPNRAQIKSHLENSLMLVTALNPVIGYDKAAIIAKKAHKEGTTLKMACLSLGYLTEEEYETSVDPTKMLGPI